jgi:hypothetical protein
MLCYLLRRLVDSGLLSVDDQSRSLERLAQYGTPFDAGIKVIRDNGLLTETGRRVIDGAETYMKAASR